MYNHAPDGYICPFCLFIQGIENEHVYSVQSDLILKNELATTLISSHQWPGTPGHVIIVPNTHYENIYDLPLEAATAIHALSKVIAFAMKSAYNCEGISTRQHNEAAGNQDVWHYHLHVFPRYRNDNLYSSQKDLMSAHERAIYAQRLKKSLLIKSEER